MRHLLATVSALSILILSACTPASSQYKLSPPSIVLRPVPAPETPYSTGQALKPPPVVTTQPSPMPVARKLEGTTTLIVGAGQTGIATVTDAELVNGLVYALHAALPAIEPGTGQATLYYVSFLSDDKQLAQLWVLQNHESRRLLAMRFDDESTWRGVSANLEQLLQPVLKQVQGLTTPDV